MTSYRVGISIERNVRAISNVPFEKRRRADKKRANALERQIAALEEEIAGLDAAIEENAKDHLALLPLLSEREEKGNQLEALYDEWAEISE